MVYSRHEHTQEMGLRPVIATKQTHDQALFEVVIQNAQGQTEMLHTTAEHPFWVTNAQDGAQWMKASLLAADMQLIDHSGNTLTVQSQTALNASATVYNIQVQEHSTYHVGHLGTWVHNANCCDVVSGANGGTAVVDGLAFRSDLPNHMIGPDGFTKSGQLSGTHNLANATSALETKGATYTLNPTSTVGVYELQYTYTNPATGKVVSGSKTVYDPVVFSDQTMINNAQQAGQQAWTQYLQNPTVNVIDVSVGGVNFRSYINVDKNGNPFIGNVHPIK
jgi:hypothetical protein